MLHSHLYGSSGGLREEGEGMAADRMVRLMLLLSLNISTIFLLSHDEQYMNFWVWTDSVPEKAFIQAENLGQLFIRTDQALTEWSDGPSAGPAWFPGCFSAQAAPYIDRRFVDSSSSFLSAGWMQAGLIQCTVENQ